MHFYLLRMAFQCTEIVVVPEREDLDLKGIITI